MENEQISEATPERNGEIDNRLHDITEYCKKWLVDHNVADKCSIKVMKRGYRIYFYGWVDSHRTKGQLFELVRKLDGLCWIQDYLYIKEQL